MLRRRPGAWDGPAHSPMVRNTHALLFADRTSVGVFRFVSSFVLLTDQSIAEGLRRPPATIRSGD